MLEENDRLRRLHRLYMLDTAPEQVFDQIAARALALLPCSAMAGISLIDADRQWFKAVVGSDLEQIPRALSFCAHVIQQDGPMIIEDASKDIRFASNPFVTAAPKIRSYVGLPLVDHVGTLCVIGSTPRRPSREELSQLQNLVTYVNIHLLMHSACAILASALSRPAGRARVSLPSFMAYSQLAPELPAGRWRSGPSPRPPRRRSARRVTPIVAPGERRRTAPSPLC